ncbi:MAG: hypothetical protein EAZ97_07025 [Bacteroidetes bacterium]|nr:MAG: hypothetical protein EAZ97_07025 [Bacteroidota bacterium]
MKIFFVIYFFLLSNLLFAQLEVIKKQELPVIKAIGSNYKFVHLSEKGLFLMLESEESLRNSKREVLFTKYDTALNRLWSGFISIKYASVMQQHCLDNNDLYYLIYREEFEYDILKINLETGLMEIVPFEKIMDLKITGFEAAQGVLFLGGMVDNMPVVLQYDYKNSSVPKVLSSIFQVKANLNALVIDQKRESVCVFMTEKNNTNPDLYFNVYDLEGKLINKWIKKSSDEQAFLTFKMFAPNSQEQYLFGTYALGNRSKAQGFYVNRFFNKEESYVYFYDFSYLNNFFNYLGEKRKNNMFEKIKKRQNKGKTFIHDQQLFLHDLVFGEDKIYLTAESYTSSVQDNSTNSAYPSSLANSNLIYRGMSGLRSYQPYSSLFSTPSRRQNFVYRYKNSVVCGFDKTGKLLWDNSFEFENLNYPQLMPILQTGFQQDSITMLHLQDKKILFKQTKNSFAIDSLQKFEPKLIAEGEDLKDSEDENIDFWYGNYFLMHGIQDIKDEEKQQRRKVFYLAKIGKTNAKKEEK